VKPSVELGKGDAPLFLVHRICEGGACLCGFDDQLRHMW
jgi:hypothetical protein